MTRETRYSAYSASLTRYRPVHVRTRLMGEACRQGEQLNGMMIVGGSKRAAAEGLKRVENSQISVFFSFLSVRLPPHRLLSLVPGQLGPAFVLLSGFVSHMSFDSTLSPSFDVGFTAKLMAGCWNVRDSES